MIKSTEVREIKWQRSFLNAVTHTCGALIAPRDSPPCTRVVSCTVWPVLCHTSYLPVEKSMISEGIVLSEYRYDTGNLSYVRTLDLFGVNEM